MEAATAKTIIRLRTITFSCSLRPRFGSVDHVLFALNRTCVAGSFWVHSCEARRAALFREDNGKLLAVLCV
jgi:hypothetical protein